MPKLKTHKGFKKRFKITATGKVMHKKCGSSHLMSHKSGGQVRRLRKKKVLRVEAERKRIRRLLHIREGRSPVAVQVARLQALAVDAILENSPDIDAPAQA
jgi:large subunit ribosomal protein L35